jgi:hypothetical protein
LELRLASWEAKLADQCVAKPELGDENVLVLIHQSGT